ncbi:CYTH domain-containing protein [Microbacterium sp.]|uniref:CYTH domain-containing protein n=1 Tax=Microbacterium sp. TaxID=51671 RepID=UPI0025F83AAF|nr:CYTH domain-containing protein [Microbacterium sp.]
MTEARGAASVEIELKFDVGEETPLPDWTGLPGVARVDGPERRNLDARYLDVADAALGRAGYALRRRSGGPDEGWHIKGPRRADGGRVETHWPLDDRDGVVVPDAVASAVSEIAPGTLTALARIRSARVAYALTDADGRLIAEFVDDRVHATDERRGTVSTWREWEFELGPAAPADAAARVALLDAATAAVERAGGRVAASDSKLARALGV